MNILAAEHPPSANYIWTNSHGADRNQVAFFRKAFNLAEAPKTAIFHLFADTRYRLLVNGHTVGHGPARFHVSHPEYDGWEIASLLQEGLNVIAVLVHQMGRGSMTNDPSRGGFIAWGKVESGDGTPLSLGTESGWKALASSAYRSDTTRLSNQLGFYENLDARQIPGEWTEADFDDSAWPLAVALNHANHWGALKPRSIALLDESEVQPRQIRTFSVVDTEPEQQFAALRVVLESDYGWPLQPIPIAFLTYLYSPHEQTLTLATSAPKCWINGQPIEGQLRLDLLWRCDYAVTLRPGWNSWLSLDQRLGDSVEMAVQWPKGAKLVLNAEQDLEGKPTFRVASQPVDESSSAAIDHEGNPDNSFVTGEIDFPTPELLRAVREQDLEAVSDLTADWTSWLAEMQMPSPFASRAWEKLVPWNENGMLQDLSPHVRVKEDVQVLLYDFGTEVLGRPHLEMTAAEGTVVDLLYTERLAGGVAHHGMQGTRMAERYVAREGIQSWHLLHPRGMRYLEVVVRGDLSRFQLHHLAVTRANYPVQEVGRFECSDPRLNQIWKVGRETLFACMEDAYTDCPWRERGLYVGDLLVHFYVGLATCGGHDLMRRCIVQLFETQDNGTGLLACTAHGLDAGLLPDYSAIAIQVVWHYWARSGDVEFVRELEPQIRRLLQGLQQIEVPGLHLMDGSGRSPYIDLSHTDTGGINCAGNCFQQRAYADGARLMQIIGDEETATYWEDQAQQVAGAIRAAFWDAGQNAFVDRRREDVPTTEPSAPGNILPLLYGIAVPEQVEGALKYLLAALANNERVPNPQLTEQLNLTSYFAFYGLQVLYDHQQDHAAEGFIGENWNRMLDAGAVTWWEYFIDRWSLCHAWSSSPTHFLSSQVLGVRYVTPGVPDEIVIEPHTGSLQWAKGVYPHPRGPISVRWEKQGEELILDYQVPEGVRVRELTPKPISQ